MELYLELLSRPRVSMISAEPDHELDVIARIVRPSLRVGGPAELERELERLVAASASADGTAARTLDLIGHSATSSQLRLGDWTIDAASPAVTAWSRGLADRGVLPRLGIGAVRLLGCHTAAPGAASATLVALAEMLGVEVHGTSQLLHRGHYDEHGFCERWEFLLVRASELARPTSSLTACAVDPGPRMLDLDALPASPLPPHADRAPTRVATAKAARQILQLIRRDAGAPMPGLAATPICQLALPRSEPGMYRVAHVLLDGAFVRFYPDGTGKPGVVYPVDDAPRLRRLVDGLPVLDVNR